MADAGGTDETVNDFLIESYEYIEQLSQDLVVLEVERDDVALVDRIFRCVHTIKGSCGFLGYGRLESVAHVGETLLSRLRDDGELATPEIVTALLALVDAMREMLGNIEREGDPGANEYPELVARMLELAKASVAEEPHVPLPVTNVHLDPYHEPDDDFPLLGTILVERGEADMADISSALQEQRGENAPRLGEILIARGVTTPEKLRAALEAQVEAAGAKKQKGVAESSVRVDVAVLNRLASLVGQLSLTRNQMMETQVSSLATLVGVTQRLDVVTNELQHEVMKTRMLPIGTVWNRIPRLVRDLSVGFNKQVTVEFEGADMELDKTIIEAIKDPLTHIVRNCVDHGIELPDVRVAKGKSPIGRLLLRAFQEDGKINIEIRDDGAGIDPTAIREKAVEKGLITPEAASRMPIRDSLHLIFMPGFSTAPTVTNVSGRGVGMDVVKTNIERIEGTVEVSSVLGKGAWIRMKIPLTLAIIPSLVVTASENRYAIPSMSVLDILRLREGQPGPRVERIHGAMVCQFHGKLLPLIYLNTALGFGDDMRTSGKRGVTNIIVLRAGRTSFGLVVDEVGDNEETVVKPLGKLLKGIDAFAGSTITADGHAALILDVLGLAQQQGVL